MNKYPLAAVLLSVGLVFAACTSGAIKVNISNPAGPDRVQETVSVPLPQGMAPERVIVKTCCGRQVPVQVVDGEVLWQADVKAGRSVKYYICEGEPKDFPTKAYSRYVPERLDDYAWENDLVAGRIYGPALSTPRTLGQDIWVKCTDRLIIDEWFAKNDYHKNHGEGMDCYKVANTLGGGALAPVVDGKLLIGDNYQTWKHICDGPIRTQAEFDYSFDGISAHRVLSLDAGTRFVRTVMTYCAETDSLDVFFGAINHSAYGVVDGEGFLAFTEEASDYTVPGRDGDISIGLVFPEGIPFKYTRMDGHEGFIARIPCGVPVTVWTASGWSQGGIESPEAWTEYVRTGAGVLRNPLQLKY